MSNLPFWKFLFKPEPTIIEKLKQAAYAAPRVLKTGKTSNFSYLEIQELANAFLGEVKEQGLLIIPNDLECFSDGDNAWVKTEFIVSDGKSRESFVSFGQGHSAEGFATGIAQTMALKSFLKRIGMTFGEEDDQEQGRTRSDVISYTPPETSKQVLAQQKYQERAWAAAIHSAGKTSQQVEQFLAEKYGVKSVTSLSPAQFDAAICWLTSNGDLSETMELSTRIAKRKAQPVASILDNARDLAGD